MAASNYEEALRRLLAHEGGYTNHPSDPGGPTNYGITLAEYARFKGRSVTAADVRAMPLADAKAIFRTKYWNELRCDLLRAGLDYAVFDYAVNSGPQRAAKVLQKLCGYSDGARISDPLIAAIGKRDVTDLIGRLCDERLAFLKGLKTWPVFGAGWSRRVAEVRSAALRMAAAALKVESLKLAPARGGTSANHAAQKGTAGAVIVTGTVAAEHARQSGAGAATVLLILAATALAAGLAWIAFRWWRRRRQRAT